MRLVPLVWLMGGLLVAGCGSATPTGTPRPDPAVTADSSSSPTDSEHGHKPGSHGGILVSLGRDSYHLEAVIEKGGQLRLYTLGRDESRVLDVEQQTLKAFIKGAGESDAEAIQLAPEPQEGDPAGRTSQFVGPLPAHLVGGAIEVTIPNLVIAGERFRVGFSSAPHSEVEMPEKVADADERTLYLEPGGLYTAADIEANGRTTASIKFRGIKSSHNMSTRSGDKVCPVTKTRANPKFTWIIAGKPYEFCCPPCVDEFVRKAKESPAEVLAPEKYVQE